MGATNSSQQTTGYSPFFLAYGSETVLPANLIWTPPRIEQYDEGEVKRTRRLELDSTEEVRVNATLQSARYLQGLRRHYDKNNQPCTFQIRDLVIRRIQKTDGCHKLLSPWEGPFIVSKVTRSGSFELMIEDSIPIRNSWHISQLRRFYT
jgi:hypothetical protein